VGEYKGDTFPQVPACFFLGISFLIVFCETLVMFLNLVQLAKDSFFALKPFRVI
jgi:hypothetical protein